jgi:hypothetical protein
MLPKAGFTRAQASAPKTALVLMIQCDFFVNSLGLFCLCKSHLTVIMTNLRWYLEFAIVTKTAHWLSGLSLDKTVIKVKEGHKITKEKTG